LCAAVGKPVYSSQQDVFEETVKELEQFRLKPEIKLWAMENM